MNARFRLALRLGQLTRRFVSPLLAFVYILSAGSPLGAQSMSVDQPTLSIDAPAMVNVGTPIQITLRLIGAQQIGGYETNLLYDSSALEFAGFQQPTSDTRGLGQNVKPLSAVELRTGSALGFFSCAVANCAVDNGNMPGQANQDPTLLAAVDLIGSQPGSYEITLDQIKLVDGAGRSINVIVPIRTLTVQVGQSGSGSFRPAPPSSWQLAPARSTATGPFDLTGDGQVTYADVMEVARAWTQQRQQGNPCAGLADPSRDVNHDGCIDVADIQLLAARVSPNRTRANVGAGAGSNHQPISPSSSAPIADQVGNGRRLYLPLVTRAGTSQPPTPTPPSNPSSTFTVNSTSDTDDAQPGDGLCRTSANTCTLRAAITEANRRAGPDTIAFNIPGSGIQTIQLNSALPTLYDETGPTTIDGYTQPGATPNTDPLVDNAVIKVQIAGNGPNGINGLVITSASNTVRGLALYNFFHAVWIYGSGASNNRIVGNFIGTNASASFGLSTEVIGANGIQIEQAAPRNRIGDTTPADRNVISGNARHGVSFFHYGTDSNVVVNNIIGLAPRADRRLPNRGHGVDINFGTTRTLVGGAGPGARNVVSGNDVQGIEISHEADTTQNQVIGNFVGTDITGTYATSFGYNGGFGIQVKDRASYNYVRDNVVGNNRSGGIRIDNYGTCCLYGNVFTNNRVGISLNGAAIPNSVFGIGITAANSQIGPGNIIANNPIGITIDGDANDGNRITQNSIYNNTGLGIDIAPIGSVNANDPGDADSGPNQQLNYPVLARATTTQVTGSACAGCRVEIFMADRGAGSYGEGKTFIGAATASGDGSFIVPVSGVTSGSAVTATATDGSGNTSEFARNISVE